MTIDLLFTISTDLSQRYEVTDMVNSAVGTYDACDMVRMVRMKYISLMTINAICLLLVTAWYCLGKVCYYKIWENQ